jgi:hypothetical protein
MIVFWVLTPYRINVYPVFGTIMLAPSSVRQNSASTRTKFNHPEDVGSTYVRKVVITTRCKQTRSQTMNTVGAAASNAGV